jgi:integrase
LPKIINKKYRALVTSKIDKEGNEAWTEFIPMSLEEFTQSLEQITYSSKIKTQQAKALSILLFYTGLRPVELIKLKAQNIAKEGLKLLIQVSASKGGKAGIIVLSLTQTPLLHQVLELAKKTPSEMQLFYHFATDKAENKVQWLKRDWKTGEKQMIHKIYKRNQNLNYFCNKWFGIPPYFFRHNRFSQASMKGAGLKQLMEMKLAKKEDSILPYLKWSRKGKEKLIPYYKV